MPFGQPTDHGPAEPGSIADVASDCLNAVILAAADTLVPLLVPIIEAALVNSDWHQREAAAMACAVVCMYEDESAIPECVEAFVGQLFGRKSVKLALQLSPCVMSPRSRRKRIVYPPLAGLLALITSPSRDPSDYVRETVTYAIWACLKRAPLRKVLISVASDIWSSHPGIGHEVPSLSAAVLAAGLADVLDDDARVASNAAAALIVLADRVGSDDEELHQLFRDLILPKAIARSAAPKRALHPSDEFDLRDSCDALVVSIVEGFELEQAGVAKMLLQVGSGLSMGSLHTSPYLRASL